MKLRVIFTYDVNPETGEMILLSKDEVTVDTTTKKSTSTKTDNNTEPLVTLDSNKLVLTQGATDLLKVFEDCRIDIRYTKDGKPIIGTNKSFGDNGGNRLTKSNTVSYRGSANTKLSEYGKIFKLEPTDNEGIYYLVGDKHPEKPNIPEEIVDIEQELDTLDYDFDFKL